MRSYFSLYLSILTFEVRVSIWRISAGPRFGASPGFLSFFCETKGLGSETPCFFSSGFFSSAFFSSFLGSGCFFSSGFFSAGFAACSGFLSAASFSSAFFSAGFAVSAFTSAFTSAFFGSAFFSAFTGSAGFSPFCAAAAALSCSKIAICSASFLFFSSSLAFFAAALDSAPVAK